MHQVVGGQGYSVAADGTWVRRRPAQGPECPAMSDDNGMLARIPGQFIAAASNGLPAADTATESTLWGKVDTGTLWHGWVRIRYRRVQMRHGRHSHWAWVGEFAETAVDGA